MKLSESTSKFLYKALGNQILRVFYDVYNELGQGFLESVYQNAMAIALRDAGLFIESQCPIPVYFREQLVGDFRADIVVEKKVILELKTGKAIDKSCEAQIMNYLRATKIQVGYVLNFGPEPTFKRLVYSNERKKLPGFDMASDNS